MRVLGVDGAGGRAAARGLGDLTGGLERLMGDRLRHQAADVRGRDDVGQARQIGRGHLVGCAPDDLDITPTATATAPPTPTPTATPLPANFVDPSAANQTALTLILDTIPARLPAGAVEWRRDTSRGEAGIEPVPRAENGVGSKIYYTEQTGGQMNLTFAVFNMPEDAAAHYEFIRGIRQPLLTGNPNDLGDAVNKNDVAFGKQFPYLAPPTSGSDTDPHATAAGFTPMNGGTAPDEPPTVREAGLPGTPLALLGSGLLLLAGGGVVLVRRTSRVPA